MTKDKIMSASDAAFASVEQNPVGDLLHWMLLPSPAPVVLIAELWVEPNVYLHDAELAVVGLDCAASQPTSFRDDGSAVWRQIPIDTGAVGLVVSWTAGANGTPGVGYTCQISLSDSHCRLLAAPRVDMNPLLFDRVIGPEAQPIDRGELRIELRDIDGWYNLTRKYPRISFRASARRQTPMRNLRQLSHSRIYRFQGQKRQ